MMAATWPFSTPSVRPLRIFLPPTSTCRLFTSRSILSVRLFCESGNFLDQLIERAIGAAAEIDKVCGRHGRVFRDAKSVGPGAPNDHESRSAANDKILVLAI